MNLPIFTSQCAKFLKCRLTALLEACSNNYTDSYGLMILIFNNSQRYTCKECKNNAKFEFDTICAINLAILLKTHLTADSLGLLKIQRHSIAHVFID